MEVKETVIRLMTRLAIEHGAVNFSQGFTDEAPVYDMVWGGIAAMLGGTEEGVRRLDSMTVREMLEARGDAGSNSLDITLKELLAEVRNPRDQLNQYSFPFGIPELRHAIADYTQAFYGRRPDPEEQITVVLGASEGMAVAFRSLLDPGDGVVVMQPYHELYPSQAAIFGLVPRFVTLREDRGAGTWRLDRDEVRSVVSDPSVKAVVVNTPHNPTGKVLNDDELSFIAEMCRTYDLFAITDEIYEHITFDGHRHSYLADFEGMAGRTLVVNSISKTGRSTGWRIGWVITPPERTRRLRAVHDNLVVQAPTPLQKGAVSLLCQDRAFFDGAPTGILRAAQPQPRAGNPQRQRHHRMQRERTLEVGQHVVAVLPEVFGHDDEPLDRGARIARIAHRDRHPVRGARERSVGVAVAKAPVAHHVRADVAVQQRCAGRGRGDRIDHRVELAVLDLDPFERVFGPIAVARHHHCHRLPRVTHPIDRKCVMAHRLLHPGDERPRPRGDLLTGQDGDDLGHRERRARVEGDDLGLCMRRAQHRGVGGAGALPHVVGEAPAPGEQCRVLHAFHRAPDETGKGARGVWGAWHAIGGSGDDWGDGRRKRVGRQPRKRRILARSCSDPCGILVR